MKTAKMRLVATGIIIGIIFTISTSMIMANTNIVSVLLGDDIRFEFNGVIKKLPIGYTTLIYEGRTYVPARFVAEELGADVEWVESTKTVRIAKQDILEDKQVEEKEIVDKTPKETVKETEVDEPQQPSGNYRKLPITKTYKNMNVTALLVVREDRETYLYISVENKEATPIQVLQNRTTAIVDGKEYKTEDVPYHKRNEKWYNNIERDEVVDGYIILPVIPEESEKMRVSISILENDFSQEVTEVEIDIELEI